MRDSLARHPRVDLVRGNSKLHNVHEVGDVGVGVVASVEVFKAEPDLGLAVFRAAWRESLDRFLETVIDRILAGDALIKLGQRRPSRLSAEVLGRHLLEQPAGAAQLKVDAELRLQERRKGSIQLLDV